MKGRERLIDVPSLFPIMIYHNTTITTGKKTRHLPLGLILISPIESKKPVILKSKFQKYLNKSLKERAILAFVLTAETMPIFNENFDGLIAQLMEMRKLGAEFNQSLLIVTDTRKVTNDAALLWGNFGGRHTLVETDIETGLKELENRLLEGHLPLEESFNRWQQ